jgi:hypothetical protein
MRIHSQAREPQSGCTSPFIARNWWKNLRARRGVEEHLPALVSNFRPRAQAKESGLGLRFYSFGGLPLEKSARLAVKGRYERSFFRQSLFKSGNPDHSIHVGVVLFSRMYDLICWLHAGK